ncbi:MAG: tRNA pseudouridine(38-40) synthase TruA [Chthoniobacterales bacterium]
MPARLKIVISYDGATFAGWQSQAQGDTVQDRLEAAVQQICGMRSGVHGAGRTDAGVHALAQCAHFDAPDRRFSPARWISALNALLPPQIRLMRAVYVPKTFHARFSASGKVYRYRIWTGRVLPPFELGRAWHVATELDLGRVTSAAHMFAGRHDFAGFAANRGRRVENTVRTLRSIRVRRVGSLLTLEFDGDGFLYKMARMLTGAIIRTAIGKESMRDIRERLVHPVRSANGPRLAAPTDGLFLVRVRY